MQFSVPVRNARLDAIETQIGASAILKIRTGAAPASCATADSGTALSIVNLLAFGLGFGGVGLWAGLAAGLACSASILTLRFWRGPWLRA